MINNRYVVVMNICRSSPRARREYLAVVNYNPYLKARDHISTVAVESVDDAFVFQERAAAEMAAVWVGGSVEQLP
ncbi:MAG: hypothetical protein AB7F22_30190 [Reyranella sp.]|uniref:hypothetical protein n=1 Tax=Reyranella sp. TaxID=1929291 RepID=UPI003D0ED400